MVSSWSRGWRIPSLNVEDLESPCLLRYAIFDYTNIYKYTVSRQRGRNNGVVVGHRNDPPPGTRTAIQRSEEMKGFQIMKNTGNTSFCFLTNSPNLVSRILFQFLRENINVCDCVLSIKIPIYKCLLSTIHYMQLWSSEMFFFIISPTSLISFRLISQ